jgi:hypothetical protein
MEIMALKYKGNFTPSFIKKKGFKPTTVTSFVKNGGQPRRSVEEKNNDTNLINY